MPTSAVAPAFDQSGIGDALAGNQFRVPANQREYSWGEEEVRALLEDLTAVIDNDNATYFLGTIVLTGKDSSEIADGQQRLATVTMIIAAIRDWYVENVPERAQTIEFTFLVGPDVVSNETTPHLTMNKDDNEFFQAMVVNNPASSPRVRQPTYASHRRIMKAAELCKQHVVQITTGRKREDQIARITKWIAFLKKDLVVILAKVPESLDAFAMFETLNDRGLEASKVDLAKNYLFKTAKQRVGEVEQAWTRMRGHLEPVSPDSDIEQDIVDFIRWVITFERGHTTRKVVMIGLRALADSSARAVQFSQSLAESAPAFAATLASSHSYWSGYPDDCPRSIETISELKVRQIRPLVFAITRYFEADEAAKALRLCVAIAVRFLVGGGRGGTPDTHYAALAHDIGSRRLTTAKELAARTTFVAQDEEFRSAFASHRASKAWLARYYLRALEDAYSQMDRPELIPVNDPLRVNLEHIIPKNPMDNWPGLSEEQAELLAPRLGNMVLLRADENSRLGSADWDTKRGVFAKSGLALTKLVAENEGWGEAEINERQRILADLAVKTWPLTV